MAIELIVAGPGKLSHPSRSCVCGSAGSCQVIVGLLVWRIPPDSCRSEPSEALVVRNG